MQRWPIHTEVDGDGLSTGHSLITAIRGPTSRQVRGRLDDAVITVQGAFTQGDLRVIRGGCRNLTPFVSGRLSPLLVAPGVRSGSKRYCSSISYQSRSWCSSDSIAQNVRCRRLPSLCMYLEKLGHAVSMC